MWALWVVVGLLMLFAAVVVVGPPAHPSFLSGPSEAEAPLLPLTDNKPRTLCPAHVHPTKHDGNPRARGAYSGGRNKTGEAAKSSSQLYEFL